MSEEKTKLTTKLEWSIPKPLFLVRHRHTFDVVYGLAGLAMAVAFATHLFHMKFAADWARMIIEFFLYVGLGVLYVLVPIRLGLASEEETRYLLTEEGIWLPPRWQGLGAVSWHSWSELNSIDVIRHGSDPAKIIFSFKDDLGGWKAPLELRDVPDEEVEKILIALEVWAPQAKLSGRLITYREDLSAKAGAGDLSFTKMWESELNRRFSTTTFIPLEPGHKLRSGTITIKRQLAFGGFSAVYLAEDYACKQIVVKEFVLQSGNGTASRSHEIFEREARLLGKIAHPQIAKLLDYLVEDQRHYLVLEYIPGRNLRDVVKQSGPMIERDVIELATQMCDILQYIHSLDPPIIHRDFSPDNIVERSNGELCLVDFGAANELVGNLTGTIVGKQSYMSPEQIRGKSTTRTDIYAFGCTLAFLLTGKDPEPLTTTSLTSISRELSALIQKLTALDESSRPSDCQSIRAELNALAKKQSTGVRHG